MVEKSLKVLVVGGGSRAARAFRRYAARVPEFDIVSTEISPLAALPREKTSTAQDQFAPGEEYLTWADAVVNFAGIPKGTDVAQLTAVNVQGPRRLAEAAKRCGVDHFIQMSSLNVYGFAERITLSTPVAPTSAYGRSKLQADEALAPLASDHFNVALLRSPVLYGGGTGQSLRALAALMARLRRFPSPKRRCRRTILHVDHLAQVIGGMLRRQAGGIQFAADKEPLTLDALAQAASDHWARAVRIVTVPSWLVLPLSAIPTIYSRLYRDNLIEASQCIVLDGGERSQRERLKDIFTQEKEHP